MVFALLLSSDTSHYENVPFEVPEGWSWCRLDEVADVARGGSPRPIKQYLTESPDGVNWIKIGDTTEGCKYIEKTVEKIIPEGVRHSRMVKEGDFLLTNSMSFGKPFILKTNGCIHDGWLVISPFKGSFDKDYLYYLLSSEFAYEQFSDKASGAVVSNLNKDKVAESLFPLPPFEEQKKIVCQIESIMNFIGQMENNIASNPQPIGFSGILLAKRQNSFYCTYFLHNRNVADTKSPYPIKRLEVIRWFNQKSMVFNQSLS